MLRRLHILSLLVASFVATGAQWDLLHVYGWGRMFATYSSTLSIAAAAKKTFSGEMCPICRAVKEAKQKENSPAVPAGTNPKAKCMLHFQPIPAFIVSVRPSGIWGH